MLEICKRHASTRSGRMRLGICVSVLFIVAMVFGLLVVAKPYAVYATGEKVSEPWVIKVNGQQVVVVESQEAADAVVNGIKATYIKGDIAKIQKTDVGKDVAIEKYRFDDKSNHPVVMTAPEAVKHVTALNEKGKSPVAVATTKVVEESVQVPYATESVDSYQYYEGRTSVQVVGVNGENKVTSEVTMINGKAVSKKALKTEVVVAPVTEVIAKGTYPRPSEATASTTGSGNSSQRSRGGSVTYNAPTSKNGAAVASFASQFAGNPYVSGGTSLTNGADCSGFTMAVFAQFGVSLPRTAEAQAGVGISVPYSQIQPGDLVCYGHHVGIYVGGGSMVHASTPRGGIKIAPIYGSPISYRRVL